jgi:uncharacterized protein involved in outer membrane biogenesis
MIFKKDLITLYRWLGYLLLGFTAFVMIIISIAYVKREDIKQRIVAEFNKKVNGVFAAEKINFTIFHYFPDFSISLQGVTLHDTFDRAPVLRAEKIYLDIGFYALFRNEINMTTLSVENSAVFLYRGKNGYKNSSVFKPKKDSTATREGGQNYALNINAITFKNLNFTYIDSLKEKRIIFQLEETHQALKQLQDVTDIFMTGKIHCNELTFNDDAGGFLQDKSFFIDLQLRYTKNQGQLLILPSTLQIANDKIKIEGDFLLNEEALFSLHISSEDLLLSNGLSYVNNRIKAKLENFSIDKPFNVDVRIRGKHNERREPEADVKFVTENINFAFGKLRIQKVTCTGQYLHRPDSASKNDDLSSIVIESFNASLEGIAFQGNVTFTKLYEPVMDLAMKSRMTPGMFNKLVDTTEWVSRAGSFTSSVKYRGKLEEYLDATSSKYHGKLLGYFVSRKGTFIYKPKNIIMKDVNGFFRFTENQFTIDSLHLTLNGSPVSMTGSMKNYIPFFIQPTNKGYVKLDLVSPRLDLSFIASEEPEEKKSRRKGIERKRLTDVLNTIQQKLQFDVALYAADLTYKKFKAQNIKGQVKLDGNVLEASKIEMRVAKGEMSTRLNFRTDNQNRRFLTVNTRIRNADIREFFKLFNDFNQTTIVAENLAGSISASANFSAEVLKNYSIDRSSMMGNISCIIRNGRLMNFEPLENISNFLFKKRDFSDVHFAELESNFDINGTNIDIDRMEVQSTVLSFFLQGRYSFTDSTSMSLQLPLNNLKKRDKDFKPENTGTDSKRGMSVYLHVFRDKDINSKINIAYDPFKKWVKVRS